MEKLREEFVSAAKSNKQSLSSLCREFGISRPTAYKWLKRSAEGYSDRSRKPNNINNKTDKETEDLILSVRKENPAWGGKTIRKVLETNGYTNLPCAKTCSNILKRSGCIDPYESLKHKPYQRFERENCNELWQTDFKGDFALHDGSHCYPLTILDDHSRFSIMIDPKPNTLEVKESFRQAFFAYGLPNAILSDNGAQFSGFRGGYTQFERWLMDSNILPIHGRIMHPQTQGKIERFHRTMKNELLKYCKFRNLEDANLHLQDWRNKYNNIRPHEAIGMRCPADIYIPSNRKYNDNIKSYDYSGTYHMIKVNSWGYLRINSSNIQVYLSETMANTYLEIRSICDGLFNVHYRNFRIAQIDAVSGKLLNRKISRVENV